MKFAENVAGSAQNLAKHSSESLKEILRYNFSNLLNCKTVCKYPFAGYIPGIFTNHRRLVYVPHLSSSSILPQQQQQPGLIFRLN